MTMFACPRASSYSVCSGGRGSRRLQTPRKHLLGSPARPEGFEHAQEAEGETSVGKEDVSRCVDWRVSDVPACRRVWERDE